MAMVYKELPNYWKEHLSLKIEEIKKAQKNSTDGVTFALITDFHLIVNEKYSVKMLEEILEKCNIPYFFNAGDNVSGCGICTEEYLIGEIDECKRLFLPIEDKCLYAEGNHDRAFSTFEPPAYYVENITRAKFNEHYFASQVKYGDRVYGSDSYYYVDNKESKVRYVVLNSHDVPSDEKDENGYAKYNAMRYCGFLQDQVDWFSKTALKLPSRDWSVIICSHITPLGTGGLKSYNYDIMLKILNAFKKGEKFSAKSEHDISLLNVSVNVNFNGAKGNVIGWFGGHSHKDQVVEKEGIYCIETMCDAAFVESYPELGGTTKEQAFDVFVVDKASKKVTAIRIGNGENREFFYK